MLNTSIIMGRLTTDPELRTTTSGVSVTRFTVAVERNYKGQNDEKKTDFIECVAWRGLADFITRFFKKGQMIALQGSIQTDTYTDKDGIKRKKWELYVEQVSFCGSKEDANNKPLPNVQQNNEQPAPSEDPQGFPFGADDYDGFPFG